MESGLQWKERDSYLCNVKALLIFMVIVGHLLECKLENEWICVLYKIIYSIHMPLFAYTTGLGIKNSCQCKKQCISSLRLYLFIQGSLVLVSCLTKGSRYSLLTPYWHLWFLLAMVWWSLTGRFCLYLKGKGVPLAILVLGAMAGACICGNFPQIGRFLSLSRAIVFFPYYLMGMYSSAWLFQGKRGWCSLAVLPGILGICYIISHISYVFLYQAAGFGSRGFWPGVIGRLICMVTAVSIGILILGWMPRRRLPWTRLGIDTLPVYILHVLFVPFAEPLYDLFGRTVPVAGIFAVLIMTGIYGLTRFHRPVCRLYERKKLTFSTKSIQPGTRQRNLL